MDGPAGITLDSFGYIYCTELYGNALRTISPQGVIGSYYLRGPGASAVSFNHPGGITLDAYGNAYIAQSYSIDKIDQIGNISVYAGIPFTAGYPTAPGLATATALSGAADLKIDRHGNLILSSNSAIYVIKDISPNQIAIQIPATAGPGVYHGTLTVSNGSCHDTTYPFTVTIGNGRTVGAIGGPSSVCVGATITLTDTTAGGTWSRSNANATVSGTGVVTGVTVGTDTITYSVTTRCGVTTVQKIITINPALSAGTISGASTVCTGTTTTLTNSITGGVWSAVNTNAVVTGTGVVAGLTAGTDTIKYTVTNSCGTAVAIKLMTINSGSTSGAITGIPLVCTGATTTLTAPVSGGAWSVTNTHASISATGVVTGVTAGVDTVKYAVTSSCGTPVISFAVTVAAAPSAGTISGASAVCVGSSTSLTASVSGGAWGTSNASAFVSSAGILSGLSAGVDTIYYAVFGSCGVATTATVVVVNPLPNAGTISGTTSVCAGASNALTSSSTGGTWRATNSNATISTFGTLAGLTAGADTIIYAVTNGCGTTSTSLTVSVLPRPFAGGISGPSSVCPGASIALTAGTAGGSWSVTNSHAFISGTGTVFASSTGTDTVIYSVTNSCGTASSSATVAIGSLPVAGVISGASSVCVGATVMFSASVTGGTWTATNVNASVSSSGLITGVGAGIDTIMYSVTNTCGTASANRVITINPLPVAGSITGSGTVCVGASTTLHASTAGGTWSETRGTAFVSSGGVVTGRFAGIDTIVYTTTNGCGSAATSFTITVSALPNAGVIIGSSAVCSGASVTMSDTASGGTFSLTNANATITSGTGVLNGISAGLDTVVYTVTNSCGTARATHAITINPSPVAGVIVGPTVVCVSASIGLTNSASGGVWSTTNGNAIVTATGNVVGVSAGIDTVKYTVVNSCGTMTATRVVSVYALPDAGTITAPSSVCVGAAVAISNSVGTGIWTVTNPNGSVTGASFTGVQVGMDTLIYMDSNSCGIARATKTIAINALPTPVITATGSVLSTLVGYITYQWLLSGTVISGANSPSYAATANSPYTVTVSDGNGCIATSDAYTPSLGIGGVSGSSMGVTIYPNPSESVVYVKANIKVDATVYAMNGQSIVSFHDAHTIDMSNFASGPYMVVVYNSETGQKLLSERIVKMGE